MGTELMPWTPLILGLPSLGLFLWSEHTDSTSQLWSEASPDLQGKGHCYQDGSASYKMHPIEEVTSRKVSHGQRVPHKGTKTSLD